VKRKELLKTLFTGKNSIWLQKVSSTNQVASEQILCHHPPDGTAVLAKFQTTGKGQAGANWESDTGKNLLLSYIFYPGFIEPRDLFALNKAIALGVYDYLKLVLKEHVAIKWPNDILYRDKKIAGILIENSVTFSEVNHSVVGIGINVNQQKFKSYAPEAESLRNVTGKKYDLEKCFAGLSNCLELRYLQLKETGHNSINKDYQNVLYRLGKYFFFRRKGIIFNARIIGVTDDGKLILQNENGQLETFRFKEVAFVIDPEKSQSQKTKGKETRGRKKNQAVLSAANNS
jgi:BirA family biotin operon repressor/biotin-[acetyl-CoA-carboxylase] ligase